MDLIGLLHSSVSGNNLFNEISLKCFHVTPLEMSLVMRKSAYAI